jgi:hypothetical protein
VYGVYYFRLNNYSGARVIIFPPFKEIWKSPLTTSATTTVTKNNHNKTGGNHAYI